MQCFLNDSSSHVVTTFIDIVTKRLDLEFVNFPEIIGKLFSDFTEEISLFSIIDISSNSLRLYSSSILSNLLLFLNSLLVNVFLERRDQINRCSDMVILCELKFVKDLQSLFALLPLLVSKSFKFQKKLLLTILKKFENKNIKTQKNDFDKINNLIQKNANSIITEITEKIKNFSTYSLFLQKKFNKKFNDLRREAVLPGFDGLVSGEYSSNIVNAIYDILQENCSFCVDSMKEEVVSFFGNFYYFVFICCVLDRYVFFLIFSKNFLGFVLIYIF